MLFRSPRCDGQLKPTGESPAGRCAGSAQVVTAACAVPRWRRDGVVFLGPTKDRTTRRGRRRKIKRAQAVAAAAERRGDPAKWQWRRIVRASGPKDTPRGSEQKGLRSGARGGARAEVTSKHRAERGQARGLGGGGPVDKSARGKELRPAEQWVVAAEHKATAFVR